MKRLSALFVATLFAFPAFATGKGNDNPASTGTTIASAVQGQTQAVSVSNLISAASLSGAASSATGGANSLTINQAPIPTATTQTINQNDYTVKNVPAVFGGNVYPTAPCMGSSTVGGAGVGFGFSVGTSWTDDECGLRETSRSFSGLGKADDALKVLCTSKYAAAAPSCAKPNE